MNASVRGSLATDSRSMPGRTPRSASHSSTSRQRRDFRRPAPCFPSGVV
jgi:hypothetical protein